MGSDDRVVGRRQAVLDVCLYLAGALLFYGVELVLYRAGLVPELSKGALALIASLFVVIALQRRRGMGLGDLGLRRPSRWWSVPAGALAVLVVTIALQLTAVPALARLLGAPPPDLSRYDVLVGNLPLFLLVVVGAMFTGGFIEEVVYRGFLIHRLNLALVGGRGAAVGAALLSGAAFGLVHFEWGVGGIVATTVMGAGLGLLFLALRRSLWPMIAAHAALDFLLLLQVHLGMLD